MAKKTLKEKLQDRKQQLKSKGKKGNIIFLKAGDVVRGRIVPTDGDEEFIMEVEHFYLGQEVGGFISPHTFGLPCAVYEKYQELKKSKDPDDKDLAKKLTFKSKYAIPLLVATSPKGGEYESEVRYILSSAGVYSSIIDLYLDDSEWGDMTDWDEGYDIKFSREGSGMTDTTYEIKPCKPASIPKKFRLKEPYSIQEAIKAMCPTYEETEAYVAQFMGTSIADDEDDDDMSVKSKKKDKKDKKSKKTSKLKKHKRDSDDDDE